ncbi:MAG TPA: SGNH/GDSL hydrolase family protein [Thermoanaerobaculia bacterium]|nr:SGNH/GDSL hydrolase family protein [Thermoanaerobaculia bacterium]
MPLPLAALALTYVILGDSTAAGVGADYQQGIAVRTTAELAKTHDVTMTNLGVSGARIHDVLVEQLPRAESLKPDLVLLAVAPNDVTHLTPISSMKRDLLAIVHRLRAANPDVAIVVTGSADMSTPRRIPRLLRGIAGARSRAVNRMFASVANAKRLTFAPIAAETGPLFRKDPSLFGPDRFHPNERGYAVWTAVINKAIASAKP